MLGKITRRLTRASLIAYGGWTLLSLVLIGGTLFSLHEAEHTQVDAVLARAETGAAAVEQTVLRLFDGVQSIEALAQQLVSIGRGAASEDPAAIDRQLETISASHRLGIQGVVVIRQSQVIWASADMRGTPYALNPAANGLPWQDETGAGSDGPAINAPAYDPLRGQWSFRTAWPLHDSAGAQVGLLLVWLDPIALSDSIRLLTSGEAVVSTVQRRSDGAFLTRSPAPDMARLRRAATNDPAFQAAQRQSSGFLHEQSGGSDTLIGYRAPARIPIVVTQRFDTNVELADFYRLRRIVLSVVLALVAGAFTATRLILANYLLRQRLSEQALLDPLTGLHNRRFFTDVLAKRFDHARHQGLSAAVLLVDLDGFKQVNDTRGHPVGDALLIQVAARLRACCGEDDLVMRLGGDEFAVVRLCRQQRRDATALARYIVGELSRTIEVDGYHLRISASVGVSLFPAGGEALHDMLRTADIALYFVKADGGDAYRIFDPAMEETVRTRRALEVDLREALNRGQLEVYYQPLVQLEPRRVSGFEALLRWHHPVLGMVMPNRFIPIAEETGMIAAIGEWVLRQACLQAATWPINTRLAVNLSPVQFERSDMVDIVASALRESRLEPRRLELEITEGVVMRDVGDVLSTMRRLQGLGVRLALDDFGTGYSSLSYLRSFPFDKVKIDASFLADLHGDGGTIIRAVLGLCGHLHLDSLVEGVETEDQLSWLRVEGCTEVQGHLFSPPRPAGGVNEVIANVAARIPASLARAETVLP
jgi:diguanylate cyclase (GGDEF)-like protein